MDADKPKSIEILSRIATSLVNLRLEKNEVISLHKLAEETELHLETCKLNLKKIATIQELPQIEIFTSNKNTFIKLKEISEFSSGELMDKLKSIEQKLNIILKAENKEIKKETKGVEEISKKQTESIAFS